MVSFNVYRSTASGAYVEGVCLATDEKPVVGIANGSILYSVDTESGETTRYMYDQNSMSWIEAACPCSGGGSGGGGEGGSNVLVVPLEVRVVQGAEMQEVYYKSTKTAAEMLAADFVVFTYDVDYGEERSVGRDLCAHMEEVVGGEFDGYCGFRNLDNSIALSCASSSDYPESEGFTSSSGGDPGDIA